MSIWMVTALMMGLAGSIHCAGMCGPIALIVFGRKEENRLRGMAIYNSGRVLTYVILGALSGFAGQSIVWFTGQQWLSVIAGVFILLSIVLVYLKVGFLSRISDVLFVKLRTILKSVMKNRKPGTLLYMGVLNGFLPCGLVYAALGGAAATGSILSGALFMALFGIATAPVLFGVALAGSGLSPVIYRRLMKLVPVTMALIGALLIIRGLGLGIPYLSPVMESGQVACCHR